MLPTFFAIINQRTLSILMITTKPKINIAQPAKLFPLAICKIAAGTNTTGGPKTGTNDINVVITPQNPGSLYPKT